MQKKKNTQSQIYELLYSHKITKTEALSQLSELKKTQSTFSTTEKLKNVSYMVRKIVANNLHIDEEELTEDLSFKELGVDSINGIEIIRDINRQFELNMDAVTIYDFPNIVSLGKKIYEESLKINGIREEYNKQDNKNATLEENSQNSMEDITKSESFSIMNVSIEQVMEQLVDIVSSNLHLSKDELDYDISFKELGVDSINSIEIMRDINELFSLNLDAVTIYDYSTIKVLAFHILEEIEKGEESDKFFENTSELKEKEGMDNMALKKKEVVLSPKITLDYSHSSENTCQNRRDKVILEAPKEMCDYNTLSSVMEVPQKVNLNEIKIEDDLQSNSYNQMKEESYLGEIAIVGVSGRFPGADNISEFWENLKNGIDSVSEVPHDRWNVDQYYDADPKVLGRTYSKVGGFLSEIDMFDPLFFNISPNEAIYMDPQQRIFLEEAWKALEDAGCSDRILTDSKCGVFVGASQGDYIKILESGKSDTKGEAFTGMATSILAARISYFLNLTGPSITVDTACSSSLVAIHLACESIRNGESNMALAGGIKLMSTPDLHISTSKLEMLSKDNKCRPFDQKADGTIMSEGVGVLVLMPLERALREKHTVYGIIKGSCINQDGKTNGITAPSMKSQMNLEIETYKRFSISPRDISLIEAHGTGTKLGDPIEVKALSAAFKEFTDDKQFCAIGSVKSNIGHATCAAGVIGVIKVLLSMRNRQIPPTLHFQIQNEHIDFEKTPFYVNRETIDWKLKYNMPRMAAVSAFGFSGTNAHIVLQEYTNAKTIEEGNNPPYYLIAFSAKTIEAYDKRIKDFSEWLETAGNYFIGDVAYTLGVGRSNFRIRGVFVTKNMEDLKRQVREVINTGTSKLYIKNVNENNMFLDKDMPDEMENLMAELKDIQEEDKYKNNLLKLAKAYTNHEISNLNNMFSKEYNLIPLPTYPFAKDIYWFDAISTENVGDNAIMKNCGLHPLIDKNISNMETIMFEKKFTGLEFYLKDHIVKGTKILPAVAYLEMAKVVGDLIKPGYSVKKIYNNYWLNAIKVSEEVKTVNLLLYPIDNNADIISFEVVSRDPAGVEILHGKGELEMSPVEETTNWGDLNLEEIRERCLKKISGDDCYQIFWDTGLELGTSFHSIINLVYNSSEGLATLELPEHLIDGFRSYKLHPTILDGALEAVIGMMNAKNDVGGVKLPYYIGSVEIFGPLAPRCYSYIKYTGIKKNDLNESECYDVYILDLDGKILVKITDFCLWEISADSDKKKEVISTIYYKKDWTLKNLLSNKLALSTPILLFDNDDILAEELRKSNRVKLVLPGDSYYEFQEKFYINPAVKEDYEQLLKALLIQEEQTSINIVYMWAKDIDNQESFVTNPLDISIYPLLYLYQALNYKTKIRVQLIYGLLGDSKSFSPYAAAFAGFSKSLMLENTRYNCRTIWISRFLNARKTGLLLESELINKSKDTEIMYLPEGRFIKVIDKYMPQYNNEISTLKKNGVYIITGGLGKLGMVFSEYLLKNYNARLYLTSRTPINHEKELKLEKLRSLGGDVFLFEGDIANYDSALELVNLIHNNVGEINGILHVAGIIKDAYLVNKTAESMQEVLNPKVKGTLNLDMATKKEKLDFFVMFSSTAAVTGNIGQADYAYANAFMDNFATIRNGLCEKKMRFGKTFSINWPLWQDGGMQVGKETEAYFKSLGIGYLETMEGLNAFQNILKSNEDQITVLCGDDKKINDFLITNKNYEEVDSEEITHLNNDMKVHICSDVKKAVGNILRIKEKDILLFKDMSEYGFNSLTFTDLANQINALYDIHLNASIFFEYPTLNAFVDFLIDEYSENIYKLLVKNKPEKKSVVQPYKISMQPKIEHDLVYNTREPIAIIGISGVMPQSENLVDFWENLLARNNLITEVPKERWDINLLPDNISKWGGFMNDIDKFDPLFFGISPLEAELMDPQQRIFLQTVWETIEDAGYKSSDIAGSKMAIFAGVASMDYSDVLHDSEIEALTSTGNSHCILTNRVSYLLNLHGPSEPIDTACSSSLVAIHRGIQSIYNGDCDTAIVGGVSVMASPTLHISFSKAGMLSSDGVCRTFDENANGYVRGEGAGAIWLKPLSKAEEDGDHIYALIKGTAVNHGGRAASLTAPNPIAQSELMVESFGKAGFNPDTISYIEAHGTGTKLGDPIEINGLKKAFAELYKKTGKPIKYKYCGISSIKPNIGHLEAAAGIASVLKVILALKYKKIPGLANYHTANSFIQLDKTPFYIVEKTQDWNRLVDEYGNEIPRRAGISSFGFGGMNAHVSLEEYIGKDDNNIDSEEAQIVILSAKTKEQLYNYAEKLLKFVETETYPLQNIAYTLQNGREDMGERLAIIAESYTDLISKLKVFCNRNNINSKGIYQNSVKYLNTEVDVDRIKDIVKKRDIWQIANLWIKGFNVDWKLLYTDNRYKKISLPTYPFEKRRIWKENIKGGDKELSSHVLLNNQKYEIDDFLYTPEWELQEEVEYLKPNQLEKKILIVLPDYFADWGEYLKNNYTENEVYQIILGNRNIDCGDKKWQIDVDDDAAIERCVEKLPTIDCLFYLGAICNKSMLTTKEDILGVSQKYGIYSFFRLIKAFVKHGIDNNEISIKVVTNNTHRVFNEEIIPYSSSILGFAKSLSREFPYWKVTCIDIDYKELLENQKLDFEFLFKEPVTADGEEIMLRSGKRFKAKLTPFKYSGRTKSAFKQGGVYIIIGGAGGIGLVLCEYLAKMVQAKIVLIGRTELSDKKKNLIKKIEAMGAKINYIKADVSNKEEMKNAISETKQKYGCINGVIHSAIVMRDMAIRNMKEDDLEVVMNPKVRGCLSLYEAVKNEKLDFIMFFSSIQSFIGNAGQANYAAACAFKDSYASYINSLCNIPVKIINWGYWGSVGVASSEKHKEIMKKAGLLSVEPDEGMEVIERILNSENEQIVMLKATDELIKQLEFVAKPVNNCTEALDGKGATKLLLKGKNKECNERKHKKLLAAVMKVIKSSVADALKMREEELDVNSPFSDYGVDSITAVNLLKEINVRLKITLKNTVIFDYGNIYDLSTYLSEEYKKECETELFKHTNSNIAIDRLSMLEHLAEGDLGVEDVYKKIIN